MKAAVVTGASSGIGLAISVKLVEMGYRVYGFARDFSRVDTADQNFIKIRCDLTDTNQLCRCIEEVKGRKQEIYILVNNAGIGFFGPHEQLKVRQIEQMVATNLQAPLILTNLLLREIKRTSGFIINISSITARKSSTHGCAYASTKAGLSHFALSLFDEVRKTGVKVITIHPDITKSGFYDDLDFIYGEEAESYITPDCIAESVKNILSQRKGTVISEITIRPQKNIITRKK